MTKSLGNSAAGSLLTAMCKNPNQSTVALDVTWEKSSAPLVSAKDHERKMGLPLMQLPNGTAVVHSLAVQTHKRLQILDHSMCFNDVKTFLVNVLSEVSLSGLGMRLEQEKLTHMGTSEGRVAESALDVCIVAGVYQPIQMLQVRSALCPR